MKRALVLLAALIPACKSDHPPVARAADAPSRAAPAAATAARAIAAPAGNEWTTPSGDLAMSRFSSLAQITAANVAQLKAASTFSTGVLHGHEGNPLVVNNMMYVVTPFPNILYAIDLTQPGGAVKWIYQPRPSDRSEGIACCDVVNRGATYANGRIYYNTLDDHTVAVDAKTGKEVWNVTVGNIDIGETMTMAPLVIKNKVIVGNSGAELGVRGCCRRSPCS